MTPAARSFLRTATCFAAAGFLAAVLASCAESRAGTDPAEDGKTGTTGDAANAPLPDSARQLLELAIRASSAIPVEPHVKDRSRAQEAVVAACLELDQQQLAITCIEQIDNWRRGSCRAELALHLARRGDAEGAQKHIDLARAIAESAVDPEGGAEQAWRSDRIRAKIATAYLVLGQAARASEVSRDIALSESAELGATRALLANEAGFDEQLAALDAELATGTFDSVRNALVTCARLFDRDYADEGRREQLEQRIKGSAKKLPIAISLQLTLDLTEAALDHGDGAGALALLNEVQGIVDGQAWLPEDHVRLMAQLAGLRGRAGEGERARSELVAALALFDAELPKIANIARAGALRPIAEAHQSLGDSAAALAVYTRAVEAGVENPNSRPRAEDLSATCCSMALHAVEPGTELFARLTALCDALGSPW